MKTTLKFGIEYRNKSYRIEMLELFNKDWRNITNKPNELTSTDIADILDHIDECYYKFDSCGRGYVLINDRPIVLSQSQFDRLTQLSPAQQQIALNAIVNYMTQNFVIKKA